MKTKCLICGQNIGRQADKPMVLNFFLRNEQQERDSYQALQEDKARAARKDEREDAV